MIPTLRVWQLTISILLSLLLTSKPFTRSSSILMRSSMLLMSYVILMLPTHSLCLSLDYRSWNWKRAFTLRIRGDQRNVPPEGFYNPLDSCGSMLTVCCAFWQWQPAWIFLANTCDIPNGHGRTIKRNNFWKLGSSCSSECRGRRWTTQLLYVCHFSGRKLFVLGLIDLLASMFRSFGFSGECLGQHSGSDQAANLGDGNGSSA